MNFEVIVKKFRYLRWLPNHLQEVFRQESFHASLCGELKILHKTLLATVDIANSTTTRLRLVGIDGISPLCHRRCVFEAFARGTVGDLTAVGVDLLEVLRDFV